MFLPDGITMEQLTMNEIGIEFCNGVLVDQDTRIPIVFHGEYIVPKSPKTPSPQAYTEFEPKNTKFMTFLFNYYSLKIFREENIYIDVLYYKPVVNQSRSPLALRANGKEYISRIYILEALKYLDLICQLNGNTDVNLDRFDVKDT